MEPSISISGSKAPGLGFSPSDDGDPCEGRRSQRYDSASHKQWCRGVPRPAFPRTLHEFQSKFATEEACQQYLAACRWPDGFVCSRCGNRQAYELVNLRRWQCTGCRHQVSLAAGTVLHNTKTPLMAWFWAAYLMTTDKRGVSALLLQRQLGYDGTKQRG